MKQILTSIIVCFAAMAAMAQNKADIEVSYTAMSPNFKNGEVDVKNQYVLLANAEETKFFSPISEWVDSINSRRDGSYYVVKSALNALLCQNWEFCGKIVNFAV